MRNSLGRATPMRQGSSSRRSMLLYGFLGILCLVRTMESAPLAEGESSGGTLVSGLQARKAQEEEVGNPSEIAYQAWLLIDGNPDSQQLGGLDSASLIRRIKPKSIFVAPNLTACSEGYQDDKMSRCVKDVNIDHQAHQEFLVQRLQALFSSKSHAAASSSIPSGPLQLNIPLIVAPPPKPAPESDERILTTTTRTTTTTTDSSKTLAEEEEKEEVEKSDNRNQDAIVTVYELNEDESTFFLGNKTSGNTQESGGSRDDPSTSPDLPLRITGLLDQAGANFSNVPEKETHNLTVLIGGSSNASRDGTYEETPSRVVKEDAKESSDISPTLVLLLSPTKLPSIPSSSELIVAHNSSLGQVVIKMENVTGNATKEIIRVSVGEAIGSPSSVKIHPTFEDEDNTTTELPFSGEEESTGSSASTEPYFEENYEESTETEDEILKHSEAGMTVTLPAAAAAAPAGERPTAQSDKEPPASSSSSEISSEVSINGDFVRETTLVDFNVGKPSNSTSSSILDDPEGLLAEWDDAESLSSSELRTEEAAAMRPNGEPPRRRIPVESAEEFEGTTTKGAGSATERPDSAETMVAASTNDAGAVVSREEPKFDIPYYYSPPSKKRAGQPFRFETTTTKVPQKYFSTLPNVEGVYDYEPRDYPRRKPYGALEDDGLPVIRTIDEQPYRPESEEEDRNFFGVHQQLQHQQQQQHVRFPSFDRHGRPNYVRFPSEEANSIHPNDYKERRPYNRYQQHNYSPVTKNPSSQDTHQKQSYWWLPPGWRMDHEQQQQHQQHQVQQGSRSSTDHSRTPMLLRFWTRMPLVREPSLNYQHPTYPTVAARDSGSARRVNYYKEMSTHDLNRAFARKSLPSAIGG